MSCNKLFYNYIFAFIQLNNDLAQQPEFVYDSTGKITGYKTPGGADTVFPFSSGNAIYLGTAVNNTFDVKNVYPDWANLTADNFIVGCRTVNGSSEVTPGGSGPNIGTITYSANLSWSYANGKLTVSGGSTVKADSSGHLYGRLSASNTFALLLLPT